MNDHTPAVYTALVQAALEFSEIYKRAPVGYHDALQDLYNREIGSHDLRSTEEVNTRMLSLQKAVLQLCQKGMVVTCQK